MAMAMVGRVDSEGDTEAKGETRRRRDENEGARGQETGWHEETQVRVRGMNSG